MRYLLLLLLACGGPPVGGESVDAGEPDAGAPCGPTTGAGGGAEARLVLACVADGGAQFQCYRQRLVTISCAPVPCPPFEWDGRFEHQSGFACR